LVRDEDVSFSLEVNVEPGFTAVRRLQMVLFRTLGLMRRLGLPPQIDRAIAGLQQLISTANQARLALLALQAVRMAAGDPIAWMQAGISVVTVAVSMGEMMTVEGS